MRPGLRCFAAALLTVSVTQAAAEPFGYAVGFDTLYRIDLANGRATAIGNFGFVAGQQVADVEGLAFSPSGELFAVADSIDVLVRVNTSTGRASLVGSLGTRGSAPNENDNLDFGLTFTCDGRLWMSSETARRLWEVDPATGVARQVGATGADISGLAAIDNQLYGIGVEADAGLYRIDRNTAASTLIGQLGLSRAPLDAGLDFDEAGRLLAVLEYTQDRRPEIASLDLATGRATVIAQLQGTTVTDFEALAIAPPLCASAPGPGVGTQSTPVPVNQPFALALLGLLLAGFAALGLRRRKAA
jgi:streptogramin lyase